MTTQKCFSSYIFLLIASSVAHPPRKHQMLKVTKLLEDSLEKAVPNDAAADYTDILIQEKVNTKNLTYYHRGDKKASVFISYGISKTGKPFHVLLRGEDFLSSRDSNNFVVLRKLGAPDGAYSVHHVFIPNMGKHLYKGNKVIWNNVKVEQQKDMDGVFQSKGNSDVQTRSVRSGQEMKRFVVVESKEENRDNKPGSKEGTGDAKGDDVIELDSVLDASKIRKRKIQKRHVSVRHRVHIPRRHHASVKK